MLRKITGVDQINHNFYISVGSNILVGLFIQTSFWLLLLSFIKRDEKIIFKNQGFCFNICDSLIFNFWIVFRK